VTIRNFLAGAAWVLAAASPAAPASAAIPKASTVTAPSCSWDRPGHDPFTGDVVAAVDRYGDIAPDVRERLKARMARRDYDDIVSIRRDSITGKARYGSTIRDMHFGTRQVCHSVTRASWTPSMEERGLVYCESGQCILVPTVCRNVSRITRAEVSPEHAEGPPEDPGGIGEAPADGGGAPPLLASTEPTFEAPGELKGPLRAAGPTGTGTGVPDLPDVPGGLGGPGVLGIPGVPVAPLVSESPVSALATPPIAGDGIVVPPIFGDAPLATVPLPVPEPGTWALMLSGLAVLGWLHRRGRIRHGRVAA